MNYKVSIIVPVYNVSKYLNRCVQSLVFQTYRNIEIILVDDGSTDDSGIICDKLKDKYNRIKVVHKQNGGLSSARNTGLDIATGDYLLFVDSDDYISTRMVELMVKANEILGLDIIECGFQKVQGDLSIIDCSSINSITIKKDNTEQFISDMLQWKNHYPMTWNKLYKTTVFRKYKFREGKVNEDEFYVNDWIKDIDEIGLIDIPLYFYRTRNDSIMGKPYSIERLGSFEAYIERYYIIKERYPKILDKMLNTIVYQFFNKLKLVSSQNNDTDHRIKNKMIEIVEPLFNDILVSSNISAEYKAKIKECKENKQLFLKEL